MVFVPSDQLNEIISKIPGDSAGKLDQIISNLTSDPDDKLVMGVYWNKTE